MRVTLLLAGILASGLLGLTNALCDVKNGDTGICEKLEDAEYIDSNKLTILKASVLEKTLKSTSLNNLSPHIKLLDLSDGEIEVVEPGTFRKMHGLSSLKMSDNYISHFKESAFEGLVKLKNFDLRRNNIRELPPALTTLKALKNLEVSGNPLTCNCATLRVRDDLLENGVKISKKVYCMTPSHLKGVSILVPETEVICMFEEQDAEMQADEAAGSGAGEDEASDIFEGITEIPPVLEPRLSADTETTLETISDDLVVPVVGRSGLGLESLTQNSTDISSSPEPSSDVDSEFAFSGEDQDALIIQDTGKYDHEEDGSGYEGSGTDEIWKSINPDDSVNEEDDMPSSSTEEPTTTTLSWFEAFFGSIASSDTTSDTEKSVTDEEFIIVTQKSTTVGSSIAPEIVEEEVVTKQVEIVNEVSVPTITPTSITKSGKMIEDFSPAPANEETDINDVGEASTHHSKKSMGSYVVLAALLGVLAALIGFAAYKSNLCKKKPNEDPERGSELKDVHKSLLDTNNTNQPKVVGNGNTENAPLVEPQDTWAGRQELRPWTDNGKSKSAVDNGTEYTGSPPGVESDPVKPPRKSLPPQDDTNGYQEVKTHSPVSSFTPTTQKDQQNSITPPNSPSDIAELRNRSPPLSPNTQRVKITLQENPDSIPKTPILITRTKPGVNLVNSP